MEREYESICYMDLKSMIKRRRVYDPEVIEAARWYLNKLGFDPEDDTLINIDSIDVKTLGYLILDIITDYKISQRQAEADKVDGVRNQSAA